MKIVWHRKTAKQYSAKKELYENVLPGMFLLLAWYWSRSGRLFSTLPRKLCPAYQLPPCYFFFPLSIPADLCAPAARIKNTDTGNANTIGFNEFFRENRPNFAHRNWTTFPQKSRWSNRLENRTQMKYRTITDIGGWNGPAFTLIWSRSIARRSLILRVRYLPPR